MTANIRQGMGLLAIAALALLLSLPAWGSESTAAGVWGLLAGGTAVVCAIVGLVKIAVDLLGSPQRD